MCNDILLYDKIKSYQKYFRAPVNREYINQKNNFIDYFGFSIPTKSVIDRLSDIIGNQKVLQLYADKGTWGSLLKENGINIKITNKDKVYSQYTTIEHIKSLDAIKKYNNCTVLLIIWPPIDDLDIVKCVKKFYKNDILKNKTVIYIGEYLGSQFTNDYLLCELSHWKKEYEISLPMWRDQYDYISIYIQKNKINKCINKLISIFRK